MTVRYFETTTVSNHNLIFIGVPVSFINSQYGVLGIDENSRFIDGIDHGLYDGNTHNFSTDFFDESVQVCDKNDSKYKLKNKILVFIF